MVVYEVLYIKVSFDGIVFDVLHLDDWMREAKLSEDSTTFEYWHHQIVVTCILNVDATAANRFPALNQLPNKAVGDKIGAPGQVLNTKLRNLDKPPALSKPREELFPGELGGLDSPVVPNSGFGGSLGGTAPKAGGGFTAGAIPSPRFETGGDFAGFKPRPPTKKPGVQFFGADGKELGKPNPLVQPGIALPQGGRGTVPFTDVELRARLRRPRRQLLVWLDSGPGGVAEYILVSPLHPDAGMDARHGPTCTIMQMPEIHGNVTGVMRLKFETWEAPALEWDYVETAGDKLKSRQKIEELLKKAADPDSVEGKALVAAAKAYAEAIKKGKPPQEAVEKAIEAAIAAGIVQNKAKNVAEQGEAFAKGGGLGAAIAAAIAAAEVAGGIAKNRKRILATPAMMSHRWTMAFGWNQDTYLKTQIIHGSARFRSDVLHMRGLSADQLRGYIWHPIPVGYRRRPTGEADVQIDSSGLEVAYVCIDDQVMMNFPGGVEYGMIHAAVELEMEYHGYDIPNPGNGFGDNPSMRRR